MNKYKNDFPILKNNNIAYLDSGATSQKPLQVINAGFTDEEREKMTELLEAGFIDTYRYFYPDKEGEYSWWSYMRNARANNAGWRIDYFIVSKDMKDKLEDAKIYQEIYGSDHCPVGLLIK